MNIHVNPTTTKGLILILLPLTVSHCACLQAAVLIQGPPVKHDVFERVVYEDGASGCNGRGIIRSVRFCSFNFHGAVGPTTPRVRRGDGFKNGESVTVRHRKFRLHFDLLAPELFF